MTLIEEYRAARRDEDVARTRRAAALRAMLAEGSTQREIATELGISQSAISQQLSASRGLHASEPAELLNAAAPVLKALAHARGFSDLAVYGSVARRQARHDSDVDLIVRAPRSATVHDVVELRELFAAVLDRPVDLTTYGGIKRAIDEDIRRDAVPL